MKLYTYWRSTSSYRVRIALALKNIEVEHRFVHLVRDGGEQHSDAYRAINPQGRVPSLELDDGRILTQSPAIIEYLEEAFPATPLLPDDPVLRAKVRSVAAIIGCDIHPLHNVAVLNYLRREFSQPEPQVVGWIATWISQAFEAIETMIDRADYCFGPTPGLADVYLIPQVYAARRFGVPMEAYPKIARVEEIAGKNAAFQKAHPAAQPDSNG